MLKVNARQGRIVADKENIQKWEYQEKEFIILMGLQNAPIESEVVRDSREYTPQLII